MHTREFTVGRSSVTVQVRSPDDATRARVRGWALAPLQGQDDVPKHPELVESLNQVLYDMGAPVAYVLKTSSTNARIARPGQFTTRIKIGIETELRRMPGEGADGVPLFPNEAFLMSSTCRPIIIAAVGTHLVVAHASCDSLIDRGAVTGVPSRKNLSVVQSIVEAFEQVDVPLYDIQRDARFVMLFALPGNMLEYREDHPQHGDYNRELGDFVAARWPNAVLRKDGGVFLDLETVFVEQAKELGIYRIQALDSLAEHPDLALVRTSGDPARRVLTIVKRNA